MKCGILYTCIHVYTGVPQPVAVITIGDGANNLVITRLGAGIVGPSGNLAYTTVRERVRVTHVCACTCMYMYNDGECE